MVPPGLYVYTLQTIFFLLIVCTIEPTMYSYYYYWYIGTPILFTRLFLLIEDEASKVGTDHLIRNITSVWKQDPGIQELEEDGSQRDGGAALQGRGSGICGHVGQLCGE